ncbi:MAG: penicillin-binding protein, partial [Firmicutes bacterium]|nr:penicillin-binding protein [Bacillota bacterium]
VIKYFEQNYPNGLETLYSGGLTIYTTIDLKMQEAAEQALTQGLSGSDPQLNGALVAVDPKTGYIKAMVGGRDYGKSQLNRSLSKRQPGSAFKPFLYAAAIDHGYTAGTTITCEPVSFNQAGGGVYQPKDYQGGYHYRPFTLKEALYTSDNVVAIRLADQVGPSTVAAYARRMGIQSTLRPYLSLPLGTSEVTPLEMAGAFGTLANGGVRSEPYYIRKVVDGAGRILEENRPKLEQALDAKTAYIVTDMLTGVLKPGGTASNIAGIINRPAAGKTGTTEDYRDAWFVGYTPDLAAAVYVGYDEENKGVGLTGGQLAAPIWARFMNEALKDAEPSDFPVPGGIVKVNICADDGLLAGGTNTRVIEAAFVQGTEPTSVCFGTGPAPLAQEQKEEKEGFFGRNRPLPDLERFIPPRFFNFNR